MPSYDFENKETGEVEEHLLKISEYDQFLKDNPHLKRVYLTAPGIDFDGNKTILQRAGNGWKEVQDKIRDLSPQHDEKNRKEVFDAIDNLENASIDDLLTPLKKTS